MRIGSDSAGGSNVDAGIVARPGIRSRLGRILRAFRHSDDGTAAVEFAFVAGPFLALMAAIFQTALLCLSEQVLDTAVNEASRLIRTGQAKAYTSDDFKNAVCTGVYNMISCSGVYVNVNAYSSFSAIPTPTDPIDSDHKFVSSGFTYNSGSGSSVVVVQVYYQYSLFLYTFLANWQLDLADLADGKRLLQSSAVFQNEPFP